MKKKVLLPLLMIPTLIMTGCNLKRTATVKTADHVATASVKDDTSKPKYITICYTIGIIDGSGTYVTNSDFYAVKNKNKVSSVALVDSVKMEKTSTSTFYYYDKVIDKKELSGEGGTSTDSVYVCFDANSEVTYDYDFYFKDQKVAKGKETATVVVF